MSQSYRHIGGRWPAHRFGGWHDPERSDGRDESGIHARFVGHGVPPERCVDRKPNGMVRTADPTFLSRFAFPAAFHEEWHKMFGDEQPVFGVGDRVIILWTQ